MNYFTNELASIGIFIICALFLSVILFIAVYIMSFTSKVEFEKSSAYECGFVPFEEASSSTFTVQFSLIAIIFLLFDIEVLYLYPIITSVLDLSVYELLILAAFFFILAVGIVYEISRQVMNMGETSSYKATTSGDLGSGASHSSGFIIDPYSRAPISGYFRSSTFYGSKVFVSFASIVSGSHVFASNFFVYLKEHFYSHTFKHQDNLNKHANYIKL